MSHMRVESKRMPGFPVSIFVSSRNSEQRLDIGGSGKVNNLHTVIMVVRGVNNKRKDVTVIDGVEYKLIWDYGDSFLQEVKNYLANLRVCKDTKLGLVKVYDLILHLLTNQYKIDGINGHLLVESLLTLSRIYERRGDNVSRDICFGFARRLDPLEIDCVSKAS